SPGSTDSPTSHEPPDLIISNCTGYGLSWSSRGGNVCPPTSASHSDSSTHAVTVADLPSTSTLTALITGAPTRTRPCCSYRVATPTFSSMVSSTAMSLNKAAASATCPLCACTTACQWASKTAVISVSGSSALAAATGIVAEGSEPPASASPSALQPTARQPRTAKPTVQRRPARGNEPFMQGP